MRFFSSCAKHGARIIGGTGDSSGILAALQIISRVSNGGLMIQRKQFCGIIYHFFLGGGRRLCESEVSLQEGVSLFL